MLLDKGTVVEDGQADLGGKAGQGLLGSVVGDASEHTQVRLLRRLPGLTQAPAPDDLHGRERRTGGRDVHNVAVALVLFLHRYPHSGHIEVARR